MCARSDEARRITAAAHQLQAATKAVGALPIRRELFDDDTRPSSTDSAALTVAGRPLKQNYHSVLTEPVPRNFLDLLGRMPVNGTSKDEKR